jgi:hypothetical protein
MRTFLTFYLLVIAGFVVCVPPQESTSHQLDQTFIDPQDGTTVSCPADGQCVTEPSKQYTPQHWDKSDLEEM